MDNDKPYDPRDNRVMFTMPPSEEWSDEMWDTLEHWVTLMWEQRLYLTILKLARA
jgi:hypothetical protein